MEHFIISSGYLAIFLFMVAQGSCIPIPSEVTMVLGGALASGKLPVSLTGGTKLNLVGVIATGAIGEIVGCFISWRIGRVGGLPAIEKFGRFAHVKMSDIQRAEKWFSRRGELAVPIGKLIPVIRSFVSLVAGLGEMSALRFGIYVSSACLVWSAGLATGGYELGSNWQSIHKAFSDVTLVVVVIVVGVAAFGFFRWRRRGPAECAATSELGGAGGPE